MKENNSVTRKVISNSTNVTDGSRKYHAVNDGSFAELYKYSIQASDFNLKNIHDLKVIDICNKFALGDIGFGDWVKSDTRLNYMVVAGTSFKLLTDLLKTKNNIGLKSLIVTFGARGQGRALAHYETNSFIINLTRFPVVFNKLDNRINLGGGNSFAHEYFHFLDNVMALTQLKGYNYISEVGSITGMQYQIPTALKNDKLCNAFKDVLDIIRFGTKENSIKAYETKATVFNDKEGVITDYMKLLMKTVDTTAWSYWANNMELMARAFEVWVKHKVAVRDKLGLLTKGKYNSNVYLSGNHARQVFVAMDKLMNIITSVINSNIKYNVQGQGKIEGKKPLSKPKTTTFRNKVKTEEKTVKKEIKETARTTKKPSKKIKVKTIQVKQGEQGKLFNKDLEQNSLLEKAKSRAKEISKKEKCVQHVNQITNDFYKIEDFYDCDTTVATYINGEIV